MCRSKLLQQVSGMNTYVYWATSFVFDYIVFAMVALSLVITLFALKGDGIVSLELGFLMLLFGWAILPFIYICSYMFTVPSTGYSRLSTLFLVTGKIFKKIRLHKANKLDKLDKLENPHRVFS